MSPLRTAILAQVSGGLIAAGLIAFAFPQAFANPLAVAAVQGFCAAMVSHRLEAPPWWLPIHLIFMPLAIALNSLNFPAYLYLIVFILLLLVFWRTDRTQVPLYLTNAKTAETVAALVPKTSFRLVDLGCGNGRLLNRLAKSHPDSQFLGLEHAPLTWLWAKLVNLRQKNCRIGFGSYWRQNLDTFDIVYAFLSPAPMSRLWMKATSEMSPGALLISNSFPILEIAAEQVIPVNDRKSTRLYCYRLPAKQTINPPYSQVIEPACGRQ